MQNRALGIAVLWLGALCACSEELPEATDLETTELKQRRLDQLRALGYVGYGEGQVPADEPVISVHDGERCATGLTLITTGELGLAELIDLSGRVHHSWKAPSGEKWSNAEILPGGDLLVPALNKGKRRSLVRLSWEGNLVWRSKARSHHDAEGVPVVPGPAESIATLTNENREISEFSATDVVKDNGIAMLGPDGSVREQASLYDLLMTNPGEFRLQRVGRQNMEGKSVVDLFHANSLEFMRRPELAGRHRLYALGNVLVSIRHQDTVAIFDWSAKRLVWAWGQGELEGQHDATVLDNGNILIFDNGLVRSWSRVLEIDPVSREIVWEYRAPNASDFFSLRKGSSQRLENGNTLVANSDQGEAFEVTPDGSVVWRYHSPHRSREGTRATIVRAKRYPEAYFDGRLDP